MRSINHKGGEAKLQINDRWLVIVDQIGPLKDQSGMSQDQVILVKGSVLTYVGEGLWETEDGQRVANSALENGTMAPCANAQVIPIEA